MRPGEAIVVTDQDHEANSGPWRRLADEARLPVCLADSHAKQLVVPMVLPNWSDAILTTEMYCADVVERLLHAGGVAHAPSGV